MIIIFVGKPFPVGKASLRLDGMSYKGNISDWSSQSIILLYQQDLTSSNPTMSSPASHLNSSDSSNDDQIYNVDSTLQSRIPNEGLPLATFYGTKNVTSPDSPSKNLRVRKLVFSKKPDYDLSPVPSPVDCSDNDEHYQPSPHSSPKKSDRPQV